MLLHNTNFIIFLCFVGLFVVGIISLILYLTIGFPKVINEKTFDNFLTPALKRKLVKGSKPMKFGDDKKSTENLEYFIISGNKLKSDGLSSGDKLLVKKYLGAESDNIKSYHYPRIVIKKGHRLLTSNYKIYRFVDYVDFIDRVNWSDLYDRNILMLQKYYEDKSYFASKCREIVRKHKLDPENQYIISVGFNYYTGSPQVYLNRLEDIYGKVIHKIDERTDF